MDGNSFTGGDRWTMDRRVPGMCRLPTVRGQRCCQRRADAGGDLLRERGVSSLSRRGRPCALAGAAVADSLRPAAPERHLLGAYLHHSARIRYLAKLDRARPRDQTRLLSAAGPTAGAALVSELGILGVAVNDRAWTQAASEAWLDVWCHGVPELPDCLVDFTIRHPMAHRYRPTAPRAAGSTARAAEVAKADSTATHLLAAAACGRRRTRPLGAARSERAEALLAQVRCRGHPACVTAGRGAAAAAAAAERPPAQGAVAEQLRQLGAPSALWPPESTAGIVSRLLYDLKAVAIQVQTAAAGITARCTEIVHKGIVTIEAFVTDFDRGKAGGSPLFDCCSKGPCSKGDGENANVTHKIVSTMSKKLPAMVLADAPAGIKLELDVRDKKDQSAMPRAHAGAARSADDETVRIQLHRLLHQLTWLLLFWPRGRRCNAPPPRGTPSRLPHQTARLSFKALGASAVSPRGPGAHTHLRPRGRGDQPAELPKGAAGEGTGFDIGDAPAKFTPPGRQDAVPAAASRSGWWALVLPTGPRR
ncbi:unnamed protein product [Prorocentrum cordatum]|uniref:Uncharacterized protein n=1 Tax=Prorocentrum cordatum TaxID=2364126 RepID=A0ABN9UJF7_9DINO|nr:unnamed protein product [Polarella glacialis]